MPLWEKLRKLRLDISRRLGIPPFVVFHDKTLMEMVALRPKSREELLQVTGVGEKKAEQYGGSFSECNQRGGQVDVIGLFIIAPSTPKH